MSRTRKPPKKSPSERFRAVLYQMYKQERPPFMDFEMYYEDRMEMLIEHYKGKLIKK